MGNKYRETKDGELKLFGSGYPNEKEERYNPYKEASKAMCKQVGGTHYNTHEIQPWNIIDEYELDFYLGNALKYLLREKSNKIEDIEKALHYLEKWLENTKKGDK